LSTRAAAERRARVGDNALPEAPRPGPLKRFFAQFADPLVGALLVAAVVALVVALTESHAGGLARFGDTIAILLIVVLNALLGFVQERRAEQALDALTKMASPSARVLRGGKVQEIASRKLVPGDIVVLEAGDSIPADLRLVEANELEVEESALTGESMPVSKNAKAKVESDAGIAERVNMAYMGTSTTRGRGRGIVVHTGAETQIGRIGALIRSAGRQRTPLEDRLARYGQIILVICIGLSALLFAIGMVRGGQSWTLLLLTAVSLAVAAIPEGLPAITTITLALGTQRMAERGAIVRKLPAVETLGSATVICTDKTGTLTENAMTVRLVETPGATFEVTGEGYEPKGEFRKGDQALDQLPDATRRLLETAALCNQAQIHREDEEWKGIGDPTEAALLVLAAKGGVERDELLEHVEVEREIPFDSERRRMTVIVRQEDGARHAHVKGAPDELLERATQVRGPDGPEPLTDERRRELEERAEDLAKRAYRVLALAEKADPDDGDDAEQGLIFLGLAAMIDPPRRGVREAVEECRDAGIQVVMVTGDHRATAVAIARELGFWHDDSLAITGRELEDLSDRELAEETGRVAVFARVSPEQKLRIVRAFKARKHVVAVTGDGVNDAPALREAPIGVAMGKVGTDVAREASAMVLADDNFATIVHAVREGRAIFRNIRKFVFFLNSSNAGLVIAVIVGSFFDWMPPLTPLQLLWINLVTNGLPALALGIDPPDPNLMQDKPRPVSAGLVSLRDLSGILLVGALMGLSALGLYWLPELWPEIFAGATEEERLAEARSMAFTLLAFSPLFHAHNCRSPSESIWTMGPFRNRWLWGAMGVSAAIHLVTVVVPPLHPIFRTHLLTEGQWLVVLGMSMLPIPVLEVLKAFGRFVNRRG
jgi:Ca2+-transporting ATPase